MNQLRFFRAILKYNNKIKFTRIDIALDDNEETVPFSKIENKLKTWTLSFNQKELQHRE